MGSSNIVMIVLPQTVVQLSVISCSVIGIVVSIFAWRNERKRKRVVEKMQQSIGEMDKIVTRLKREASQSGGVNQE